MITAPLGVVVGDAALPEPDPEVDAAGLPPAADAAVGLPLPETPATVKGDGGADADAPMPTRPPIFCCHSRQSAEVWDLVQRYTYSRCAA